MNKDKDMTCSVWKHTAAAKSSGPELATLVEHMEGDVAWDQRLNKLGPLVSNYKEIMRRIAGTPYQVKLKAISREAVAIFCGRTFNDYPEREYIQADGSGAHPEMGEDIVWSTQKCVAASLGGGLRLATSVEHNGFGGAYQEHKVQWTELFDQHTSEMAWEEDVLVTGFGLAQVKPQGRGITYEEELQGYIQRYTHVVYALGFIVSWEEQLNNLYEVVGKRRAQRLAFTMRQTKEWVCANVYNRAFNSSYTGGDGVELCSDSHPTSSGLQSNIAATPVDICETGIEDLMIQVGTATNDKGHPIGLLAQKLIVPWQLWYEANRILQSVLQNDSAMNAINALKVTGALPQGIVVNNYLTDPDNYFIRTNCPDGAKHFQRYPLTFDEDNDFDTKNMKYAAVDYYSVGWSDWRTVYGCEPA